MLVNSRIDRPLLLLLHANQGAVIITNDAFFSHDVSHHTAALCKQKGRRRQCPALAIRQLQQIYGLVHNLCWCCFQLPYLALICRSCERMAARVVFRTVLRNSMAMAHGQVCVCVCVCVNTNLCNYFYMKASSKKIIIINTEISEIRCNVMYSY